MTTRERIPAAPQRAVLDGSPCVYCGEDQMRRTVDHVLPVAQGGTNDRENLVPACWRCNKEKLDFTVDEWRLWRLERGYCWPPESFTAELTRLYVSRLRSTEGSRNIES